MKSNESTPISGRRSPYFKIYLVEVCSHIMTFHSSRNLAAESICLKTLKTQAVEIKDGLTSKVSALFLSDEQDVRSDY